MAYKLTTIAVVIGASLLLISCSLRDQEIRSGWWKYGKGYHLGDVVDFKKDFHLRQDTISQNGQRVGVITRKQKSVFDDDYEIEITSMDGSQTGVYHQK